VSPETLTQFTVVLRCAESMVRFPLSRGLQIAPLKTQFGEHTLKFLTRTDQAGAFQTPLPREVWIEVTGPAPSIEVALAHAAASANEYVRQLAFAANAWQGLLSVHLAYDSTPGKPRREFFQNWIRDETGLPRVARSVDPDLMYRVLAAVAQLPTRSHARVSRAIVQYTDALQHWKPGSEVYALSHLYMGVEAITPLVLDQELRKRNLKRRRDLERQLGGPPPTNVPLRLATYFYRKCGGYIPSKLDSWVRSELIFRRDQDTFRAAKRASDHFEHGVSHHHEVHELAVRCLPKTAQYLRDGILELLSLEPGDRLLLAAAPYALPASTSGFERQLLATIDSTDADVAAPDQAYPLVTWRFDLKEFSLSESGEQKMRVAQSFTPMIGVNAKMNVTRVYFAGASEGTIADVELADGAPKTPPRPSDAGITYGIDEPSLAKWVHPLGSLVLNINVLRHFALYWLLKLWDVPFADSIQRTIEELVAQISNGLADSQATEALRTDCLSAWEEAVQFDEVREMMANAFTQPEGLVTLTGTDGAMPLVADVKKLVELNTKVVSLAKHLGALLDELVRTHGAPLRGR
jgi:hypothetical protein